MIRHTTVEKLSVSLCVFVRRFMEEFPGQRPVAGAQ
jgi:hypothetical protein